MGDTDTVDNLARDLIVHASCRVGSWRFLWVLTGKDTYGQPIDISEPSAETYVTTCP